MKNKTTNHNASRRGFLKKGAVAAAAMASGLGATAAAKSPKVFSYGKAPATGSVLGANDRLVVGFIGVGGQGFNSHLGSVHRNTDAMNAVGAAACDLFADRRDRAAAKMGELSAWGTDVYSDYREIIDRDDIDAVFIGTVDHWHAQIAIDAMDAGKHVYCEKPMTRYLGEAFDIYDKAMETGMKFQVGSQYCTEGKWHKAAELIQSGMIGAPVLAQDSYCRNNPDGEWNYGIDQNLSPDTVDWKTWLGPVSDRPFSADEYHRWRKYYPYCAGILGDLLAHRIHPLIIATGAPEFPVRVSCHGTRKVTPDRDVPDNTQLIAEMPSGMSMVILGSTVNEQGLGQVIRGHEATLYFGGNRLELRPERPFADLADQEIHENIEPGVSIPAHISNFFDAIRTDTQPNGNIDVAIKTQTIISLAEMSDRMGMMLFFDEETRKVTTGDGSEVELITYGTMEQS
ncbi:MAG: Gfo/Idh/MocA family oxidoreductase [Bacteroidota bacterium]